jgi:hypothetical protein
MRLWTPFLAGSAEPLNGAGQDREPDSKEGGDEEIERLRRQISDMQKTIETIARRK